MISNNMLIFHLCVTTIIILMPKEKNDVLLTIDTFQNESNSKQVVKQCNFLFPALVYEF